MKLVTLIDEGTIVAINYTMAARFLTREIHMIDDSSATATRATPSPPFIQPPSPPSINPRNSQVSPKRPLPALALTLLPLKPSSRQIQTVLEAKVATNLKFESVDRPSTELAREAERVITVPSANAEVDIGVEGLNAMDGTGVGLADVESVILYDGNTRVRFVQTVVKNSIGSAKIATNVDADKVCVLVTAFYGASIPEGFFKTLDTDSSAVSASEGTKVEGEPKKPVEKLQSSEITPSLEPMITKPMFLEEKKADCKRRQGRQ
ncbi:hypothetical protein RSOLAG22IIIB_06097 [Rhizoctonia solani]|uniref:Uncharacterized protein n=1 Tax=Rhizoctonia solani TaxID=456999 RepID=A0A0K6GCA2_9AGAM|nr:hypothetical protein RSOLAG22IIIB_06097 [Rhizoctonia solani]